MDYDLLGTRKKTHTKRSNELRQYSKIKNIYKLNRLRIWITILRFSETNSPS